MHPAEIQIQKNDEVQVMNYSQRTAKFIIERIVYNLWGFKPALMQELVRRNGGLGALLFVGKNMTRFEYLISKWGSMQIHLLGGNISVLNGCPYCIHGHALAFNLHYFNDYGELFKMNETEFIELAKLPEEEKISKLRSIYSDARISHLLPKFEIQLELRAGRKPKNREERHLQFVNTLYDYLNACGIETDMAPDEAHDRINKDKALIKKYNLARMF